MNNEEYWSNQHRYQLEMWIRCLKNGDRERAAHHRYRSKEMLKMVRYYRTNPIAGGLKW